MSDRRKPRLRYFEHAPGQRHITATDRYLYAPGKPRYRLNVIGAGTIGQEHMRVATLLGHARVHGIYDRAAHSADVAEQQFRDYCGESLQRYKDLESACNDPAVDALLICTPNHTHCEVLQIAAGSGKPILLEKPMATTVEDARTVYEIAADYPTFIQVGLQYRYKAPYVEARHEALTRKSLGEIQTIAMSEYRPPFLDKVEQWNKFTEFSGGTLVEKCCHYFDLINLFAMAEPRSIYALGGQAVNFRDFKRGTRRSDIDDHVMVIIDYKNDIKASFTLNMFSPHFYEELVLCGDQGRLSANETFDFLRDDVARSTLSLEFGETAASRSTELAYPTIIEQSGHHGSTFFEHVAFIEQLDGRTADCATPLEGLWSIIVAAAAQESMRLGQVVDIDGFVTANALESALGR